MTNSELAPLPADEDNPMEMAQDDAQNSDSSTAEVSGPTLEGETTDSEHLVQTETESVLEETAGPADAEDPAAAEQLAADEDAPKPTESADEAAEPSPEELTAADADTAEAVEGDGDATEPDADESQDEQVDSAEEEPEPDDGRAWFVVHSYSGYENKVKNNLEHRIESMNMQDKIFQVVVPTEEEIEIREGHRRKTKRRVFPGYILVQMLMDEESWYVVRNTPGVTGFVGTGSRPTPLRPEEARKIFDRMEMEAPKIKVGFREGQTVRIADGPFVDFVGVVENLNLDKGKVTVMVSFFGRDTPVELDLLQVQKQ